MRDRLNRLQRVWDEPGDHPSYHEYQKSRLKLEWPLLHRAIEDILFHKAVEETLNPEE